MSNVSLLRKLWSRPEKSTRQRTVSQGDPESANTLKAIATSEIERKGQRIESERNSDSESDVGH